MAKFAEAVKQLSGGSTLLVDEIHPQFLKVQDISELSWLTCLYNAVWTLGTVPLRWQTGGGFKKGDQRVFSKYRALHHSHPGKVYARVLEWRVHLLVKPHNSLPTPGW